MSRYTLWSHQEDTKHYTGTGRVADSVPAGMYSLSEGDYGEPILQEVELKEDDLYTFSNGPMPGLLKEIDKFWESRSRYNELGVTHKRGLLMHGPPGCGKSGILAKLIQDVVESGGIAIKFNLGAHENLPKVRQIEGDNRRVLIVFEDVDSICGSGRENLLLEMLDGTSSMGANFLFAGTTNFLGAIPPRIRCRPSRIDTLLEVPHPCKQQRREYLDFICTDGFKRKKKELDHWADETEGFSLAALKEVVLSVAIYEVAFSEVKNRLLDMEGVHAPSRREAETPRKKKKRKAKKKVRKSTIQID